MRAELSPHAAGTDETIEALLVRIRHGAQAVALARKKPELIRARRLRDRAIITAAPVTDRWRIVDASGLSAARVQQIIGNPAKR